MFWESVSCGGAGSLRLLGEEGVPPLKSSEGGHQGSTWRVRCAPSSQRTLGWSLTCVPGNEEVRRPPGHAGAPQVKQAQRAARLWGPRAMGKVCMPHPPLPEQMHHPSQALLPRQSEAKKLGQRYIPVVKSKVLSTNTSPRKLTFSSFPSTSCSSGVLKKDHPRCLALHA